MYMLPGLTSRSRTSTPSSLIPFANCTSSSYKISAVPVWMYTFVPALTRCWNRGDASGAGRDGEKYGLARCCEKWRVWESTPEEPKAPQ